MSEHRIIALDQIKLEVRDLPTAVHAMERLLARDGAAGEDDAVFHLDNVSLALSPSDRDTEGLAGLAFEITSADVSSRTLARRALAPRPVVAFAETDALGAHREGHYLVLDQASTHGVPIKLVEITARTPPAPAVQRASDAVTGLDHVVIRTAHPNRAAALYGARLGLDMRLDRTEPKWASRLMFFRCGDLIVEIVHDLKDEPSDGPDRLWGLSWRVTAAAAAHARLKSSGFNVSDLRPGRKPGTRVFTVRDNTLNVPTLIVEPSKTK